MSPQHVPCMQYYLGRTWITDIPRNYGKFKDKVNAIPETIHEAAVNSTLNYLLNALGLWVRITLLSWSICQV